MQCKEAVSFSDDGKLDNFSDIARRTSVIENGLFIESLDFKIPLIIKLDNKDDFILSIEQDYYLSKLLNKKLHYIVSDDEIYPMVKNLVEAYLSIGHINNEMSKKARSFILSNLNLI